MEQNDNHKVVDLFSEASKKKDKTLAIILVLYPVLVLVISIISHDTKSIAYAIAGLLFDIYFANQLWNNKSLSTFFSVRMGLGILLTFAQVAQFKGSKVEVLGTYIIGAIQILFNTYFLLQVNGKFSEKRYKVLNYTFLPLIFIPLFYVFFALTSVSSQGKNDNDMLAKLEAKISSFPDRLATLNRSISPILDTAFGSDDNAIITASLANVLPLTFQRRILLDTLVDALTSYSIALKESHNDSADMKIRAVDLMRTHYTYQIRQGEEIDSGPTLN